MKNHLSRRIFIRNSVMGLAVAAMGGLTPLGKAFGANGPQGGPKAGILVSYFSHSGNTRYMAEQIHP